jgi:hypothetical protein
MGPLHEEARWLSDGDGMRCYFSEGDRRGPSRLQCYRRLLAKPDDMKQGGYRSLDPLLAIVPLQRFAALLELGRKTWRSWSSHGLNAAVAGAPVATRFTSDFESDLRLSLDE